MTVDGPSGPLPSGLQAHLDQLAGILFNESALGVVLDVVVSLAVGAVPGVDAGSVSLVGGGPAETFAATSAAISEIDSVQYAAGRGPCLSAMRDGRAIIANFDESHSVWPEVAAAARSRSFESILSLPLGEERVVGALNLYSRGRNRFGEDELSIGVVFARHAATVVANATALATAEVLNHQLAEALTTRDVIGQAKGVLRERHGYGDQEAFDALRRVSQRDRKKLRDVAQGILDSTRAVAEG